MLKIGFESKTLFVHFLLPRLRSSEEDNIQEFAVRRQALVVAKRWQIRQLCKDAEDKSLPSCLWAYDIHVASNV